MSLQLIIGGAGSGKTTFLFQQIIDASCKHPEQKYFLIVPEQFTMQTQKDIITMHPNHGTMNIDMVSFNRLAYHVFEELAVDLLSVLDDTGKTMILRKVTASLSRKLGLYQGHLNQNGFIDELKSVISEFYQYGVTAEVLAKMAEEAPTPLLSQKMKDFSLIFQEFQSYIEGHYITTEEVLDVLCRRVPDSALIKNSVIALDNFTGFTPVQYRLLELCMKYAKQVIVTVTMDADQNPYQAVGMQNLFYMSAQVAQKLSAIAEQNEIPKNKDIILRHDRPHRFQDGSELDFLEKHLFRYHSEQRKPGEAHQIRLYRAAGRLDEVSLLVRNIRKLVCEEGLRYRDIAVVTGDLAGYGKDIGHQFDQNGIPYFIDDRKNILENPAVELIRATLEVIRKDFSYESVFRYLKTGLVADDSVLLDRLENYVLALGIRGFKNWSREWTYLYRGGRNLNLDELNVFRSTLMKPLTVLKEAFSEKEATAAMLAQALREFLIQIKLEENLQARCERFEVEGSYALVREYSQIYDLIMDLFDKLEHLLGDEVISKKEFGKILDAGFEEMSVGLIPATVDRVSVGDITRTRLNHVKVLMLVGVNDGIIPQRSQGGGLLTDRERNFLGEHQVELAPGTREDSFKQRFYLYLIMTKPQNRLILSYAGISTDGKSIRPSYLIGELKKLFPYLEAESSEDHDGKLYSLSEMREELINDLRSYETKREEVRFLELYRFFMSSDESRERVKQLVEAAFYTYEEQGIGRAAARALYGNVLSGSVTRLELYASCAYAHFLKYGLELEEREEYELKAVDIGNLFHNSIELCFTQMKEAGGDWKTLDDVGRKQLVSDCVRQVTEEYGNTIMQSSARNSWLAGRVEKITDRTVWALQQQLKKGDFTPAGFEVSFSAIDNLAAMKIALSEDEMMHLKGRIDRLDLCEDEQHVYVKIIDYKSGGTSFDLAALYYGLRLQLVVYMDAVMELEERKHPTKQVVPAGLFYYNIQDPMIDTQEPMDQEAIDARILRQLRMNGLVNSELEVIRHLDHTIENESDVIPVVLKNEAVQDAKSSVAGEERFRAVRNFVRNSLKNSGISILSGDSGISPYKQGTKTACDYCPYHPVCGFDKKMDGYQYHYLKKLKPEDVWTKMEEQT